MVVCIIMLWFVCGFNSVACILLIVLLFFGYELCFLAV